MPNDNEHPKYTGPNEYHAGDGPFQFPWWAIVIGFVVWWPLGFIFIGLNAAMKNGKLGGFEQKARERTHIVTRSTTRTVYEAQYRPIYDRETPPEAQGKPQDKTAPAQPAPDAAKAQETAKRIKGAALATGLTVAGVLLLLGALAALPGGVYWLPDALTEGDYYWRWLLSDLMPVLLGATTGIGCLFGAQHIRTSRRMRRKIENIVGDSQYMYIQDIADAIPCSYDKCCKYLENCIDEGLLGPDAYLDMHRKCLVVTGKAPEPEPKKPRKPKAEKAEKPAAMPQQDKYQKILDELHRVNDAIPDEEMTDKISRLEAVAAKIFEQARTDPDKLPQMRKFMDYYLPTSLKLLNTYAELDRQGIEGENITESKRRIEQTMDTLVDAFENQLDRLFASDALDVSTDIDVMQNMLRADGLTEDEPFKL
ncbi:MAG: 5-bromo-4-chloroindolyl phosphate hydrolysis family protein [Oscillospiraceae bacterium]|nr:5-bromo-4-chloroindolyl phosphate hydrolysis family protein [Oscillospiraceae bacterium]